MVAADATNQHGKKGGGGERWWVVMNARKFYDLTFLTPGDAFGGRTVSPGRWQ